MIMSRAGTFLACRCSSDQFVVGAIPDSLRWFLGTGVGGEELSPAVIGATAAGPYVQGLVFFAHSSRWGMGLL